MSHFFVGVIVKDLDKIDKVLSDVMAPYNENIQVKPYEEDCGCIGGIAREEIWKQMDDKFGTIEKVRDDFWKEINQLPEMKKDKEWQFSKEGNRLIEKRWKKLNKERWDTEKFLRENHPDINKPNIKCEDCNGTGRKTTTYNPKSKWDWYVVGGRWDGCISNDRADSEDGGFNFGDKHHQFSNNIIPVKKYLRIAKKNPEVIPFAIVTPDGEWCEKGEMGWFGIATNEKDEEKWLQDAYNIVNKYPNHYIIGVDCHI